MKQPRKIEKKSIFACKIAKMSLLYSINCPRSACNMVEVQLAAGYSPEVDLVALFNTLF